MDTLRQKLKTFNAHSIDTANHFKLCTQRTARGVRHEIRLCSSQPRHITCTADLARIHVHSTGPSAIRLSLSHDPESLKSLLTLLHDHRDDTDTLLDWELEDWVGAGYPCRMHARQEQPYFPDLGFMPEDLWCVELLPSVRAHI